MARIRSLKPEFWDDRKLARSTSRDARMLYMGLWNQADEHCRLNGDSLWLKGRIFPYEDDIQPVDVEAMLAQLEKAGRVQIYDVDGDPFLYLPKLGKHQRLEPAKVESRHPEPPAKKSAPRADESAQTPESGEFVPIDPNADLSAPRADSSALLYVTGSMGQGSGSRGQGDSRGSRIPDEWMPDQDLIDAMRGEGISDDLARRELPKFRDYWAGIAGAKGRKSDWRATWRNWLRRAAENEPSNRTQIGGSTADQRVNEGRRLAAELRAEQSAHPELTA